MATPKMNTLEHWQGDFGREYTDRNVEDYKTRIPAFAEILAGVKVERVLEVGCNRGHNLAALAELLGPESEVVGLEPNRYALRIARAASTAVSALHGSAFDLPFRDGTFDLVFTAGVLIHVALADLPTALREISRVSRRYILCMEYFAEEETEILYRGETGLLWKRNFLRHYQEMWPSLQLLKTGYLGPEQGWDRITWWLLEKR